MSKESSPKSSRILNVKNVAKWDVDATCQWLTSIGYHDCDAYFKEHRINGIALLMLDEDDMKEVIKHNVGQRKNLYHMIRLMQIRYNRYINKSKSASFFSNNSDDDDDGDNISESSRNESENDDEDYLDSEDFLIKEPEKLKKNYLISEKSGNTSYDENFNEKIKCKTNKLMKNGSIHHHLINEANRELNQKSPSPGRQSGLKKSDSFFGKEKSQLNLPNFCENCLKKFDNSPYSNYSKSNMDMPIRCYKGEKRKTLVSMLYIFCIGLWTSFILTVVHDRVPDMQKYPPLPDIILDNVPLIPWAFFASEAIGICLLIILLVILFFHKYRLIIFRRICSLGGTIFFLRSITMLITSLSVPGIHIQCASQRYGSLTNKIYGAWNILTGAGLYASGIRTCGDYMFSGHTVWITLTTHFISEYTPRSMHLLHTGCWVLNIFGLFFILGAHEHYSIDVFVGFYITSRLFLYYHSLANNKALFQRDHKRVKIWFPLLSYFESNIHSIVPNEYHCPPNPIYWTYRLVKNKSKQAKRLIFKQRASSSPEKTHTQ